MGVGQNLCLCKILLSGADSGAVGTACGTACDAIHTSPNQCKTFRQKFILNCGKSFSRITELQEIASKPSK